MKNGNLIASTDNSAADPGCFSRIPKFGHVFFIPDPGIQESKWKKATDLRSRIRNTELTKNLRIQYVVLTQKSVARHLQYNPGFLFNPEPRSIPDPDFFPYRIPESGGQKSTGSWDPDTDAQHWQVKCDNSKQLFLEILANREQLVTKVWSGKLQCLQKM